MTTSKAWPTIKLPWLALSSMLILFLGIVLWLLKLPIAVCIGIVVVLFGMALWSYLKNTLSATLIISTENFQKELEQELFERK